VTLRLATIVMGIIGRRQNKQLFVQGRNILMLLR